MRTLYAFGDSMLDCSHYTADNVTPGTLLCENRDDLFPEFARMDLASLGPWQLAHRARDGATLPNLAAQWPRKAPPERSCAIITIGGNDLLQGLLWTPNERAAFDAWFAAYEETLRSCPVRTMFVANVYDPTFGRDELAREFVPAEVAELVRARLKRFNDRLAASVASVGATLIDVHARFAQGDPCWCVQLIEPSSRGASELRRAFLPAVLAWARDAS